MAVPSSLTTSATILFPRETGGSTAIPPLSCSMMSGGVASLAAPPTRATFNTSTKSLVRFLLSMSSITSCVSVFSSSRPPDSYRCAMYCHFALNLWHTEKESYGMIGRTIASYLILFNMMESGKK